MPDHGGFAVAVTIRERVINDAILRAYSDGTSTHRLVGPLPGGPPAVLVDFFLEPPHVRMIGDDPDLLVVDLSGWGPLAINWGGVNHVREIRWQLRLAVQARFVVAGTNLVLSPGEGDFAVEDWGFVPLAGGPYPSDVDLYLSGGIFRNRLLSAVFQAIQLGLLPLPPIDVSYLGTILQSANMDTGSRVTDGSVIVGLNVATSDISTSGDADLLVDFARNNDIATLINPVAVPATVQGTIQQVRDAVAQQGATLESLTLVAEEGQFRVDGRASDTGGSVSFSFQVIPLMFEGRPGAYLPFPKRTMRVKARTWPALAFRTANVQVSVNRAWWVVVAELVGAVVTGAVIPLVIEDLVRRVSSLVTNAIETAPVQAPIRRVRRIPAANPGGPTVRVEIAEFEIHVTGVFTGITIQSEPRPGRLAGLKSLPRNLINNEIEYRVHLGYGLLEDDPKLRVRWTVIDLDTGNILVNTDDIANDRLAFSFVPGAMSSSATRFGVMCRVYRALGPNITEFLNEGITLQIRAPIPPGQYVRWLYNVKNPQVRFDQDRGAWWYGSPSELVVYRWSAIHRLDSPCQNATERSRYAHVVEFLDRLPFPIRHILDRRDTVCEYCFFGGPGHHIPSL